MKTNHTKVACSVLERSSSAIWHARVPVGRFSQLQNSQGAVWLQNKEQFSFSQCHGQLWSACHTFLGLFLLVLDKLRKTSRKRLDKKKTYWSLRGAPPSFRRMMGSPGAVCIHPWTLDLGHWCDCFSAIGNQRVRLRRVGCRSAPGGIYENGTWQKGLGCGDRWFIVIHVWWKWV